MKCYLRVLNFSQSLDKYWDETPRELEANYYGVLIIDRCGKDISELEQIHADEITKGFMCAKDGLFALSSGRCVFKNGKLGKPPMRGWKPHAFESPYIVNFTFVQDEK